MGEQYSKIEKGNTLNIFSDATQNTVGQYYSNSLCGTNSLLSAIVKHLHSCSFLKWVKTFESIDIAKDIREK